MMDMDRNKMKNLQQGINDLEEIAIKLDLHLQKALDNINHSANQEGKIRSKEVRK